MTTNFKKRPRQELCRRRDATLADIHGHLRALTTCIKDRSTGSPGNQAATDYVRDFFWDRGWSVDEQEFDALDWKAGAAMVIVDGEQYFDCNSSPYSEGCDVVAPLVVASSLNEVRQAKAEGTLLLLTGDIAKTPLMPKNFPFYTDDAQQDIIAALEASGASAILTSCPQGPMIEDGDFGLPSVHMPEDTARALTHYANHNVRLVSKCYRRPSRARNIVACINATASERIIITAHIDAKKDVPGALDNGTGITMLLLLAQVLATYQGPYAIELVALNGEDHYAAPGQLAYLKSNPDLAASCALNINIDGIGYREGKTAYSYFQLPTDVLKVANGTLTCCSDACEGVEWVQGDHAMFVQAGCPAIAVTSNWLLEHMFTQTITHSMADEMSLVDPERLLESAFAIQCFIEAMGESRGGCTNARLREAPDAS